VVDLAEVWTGDNRDSAGGASTIVVDPGLPELVDGLPEVATDTDNFRWGGKWYFLTWAQISELPNAALTAMMEALSPAPARKFFF